MCQYKLLLRVLFRTELCKCRKRSGDTQEAMAEKLHISPRSYLDLEHGKYSVSSVTLLFFLALLPDNEMVQVVHQFELQAREADEHVHIA